MNKLKTARTWIAAIGAVALIGLASACTAPAANDSTGGGDAPAELTKMKIALIPISPVSPIMLGIEQGFFEDAGIDLTPQMINEGPAIVPAVMSNDVQAGFAGMPSIIKAFDSGLSIQLVAGAEQGPGSAEEDHTRMMVMCDGPIKTPADLEGQKVAIGALGGIDNLVVNASLANGGADLDKVTLVEVPFDNQFQAMQRGEVAAINAAEPYSTIAERSGACELTKGYSEAGKFLPIAGYLMNIDFIEKNPELTTKFVEAINRSNEYANKNPDEIRRILTTYTAMSEEDVKDIPLPGVPTRPFTSDDLVMMAELMSKFSDYSGTTEVGGLLWQQ